MLARRLELHQIDDVDHANLQFRQVTTEEVDRRQRLEGRYVPAASQYDVGIAPLVQ